MLSKEHAIFAAAGLPPRDIKKAYLRGYLDPSEVKLFETADAFVREFGTLQQISTPKSTSEIIRESLRAAMNLRDFKRLAAQGSFSCKVKSIKTALFYDHVVRGTTTT